MMGYGIGEKYTCSGSKPLIPEGWCFLTRNGELRSYSGFRRQFERFMKGKGIGKVTFHQFRHTFATMMLEQQVNPRVVQDYLGP